MCSVTGQRPPPAQAQAHPAQAQAQAQAHPPPPLRDPPLRELPLEVLTGTGLVLAVTPEVKLLTLPITPAEKFDTPLTTEAAKSDPGRLGRLRPPPPELEGTPVEVVAGRALAVRYEGL